MKNAVEFVNNTGVAPDPIGKSRDAGFRNIVTREEYRESEIRFRQGLTWLRFLPSIKGSAYDWMMPIDIHQDMAGTTFTSPRTFDPNAPCVFESARLWFKRNKPEALYSREGNENGLKLFPKKQGVSWVIEEQAPEGERLRLLIRSLYDGTRGGTTGLCYNIRREADSRDNEPGSSTVGQLIHGDITDPTGGRLVKVERVATDKSEYANYKIGIGKNPAPINHFMGLLTEKENNTIVPLERTIYIPTEEEQKEILRRYIGDAFFNSIFGGTTTAVSGWSANREPEAEPATRQSAEEPVTPKAAEEKPEPKPAAEPEPVAKPVAEAKPVEAAPAAESDAPYATREVTGLLRDEAGVRTLLKNKHRLSPALLEVVLDNARELQIATE